MSVTMPPTSGITLMTPMPGAQLLRPAMTIGPHTAIMTPTAANMGMLRPSPVGFPGNGNSIVGFDFIRVANYL